VLKVRSNGGSRRRGMKTPEGSGGQGGNEERANSPEKTGVRKQRRKGVPSLGEKKTEGGYQHAYKEIGARWNGDSRVKGDCSIRKPRIKNPAKKTTGGTRLGSQASTREDYAKKQRKNCSSWESCQRCWWAAKKMANKKGMKTKKSQRAKGGTVTPSWGATGRQESWLV